MSSSQPRSGERMIHQDFIARIRYSNALPPPPNPPKLLDIPNTGLSSGQYTNPGFASRLAREQPLNIEADAELGMPLDLVGMPGIFDGDESSIQASAHAPLVHPHDRPLLRPLASLGRPKVADHSVSFLRRTEYISSLAGVKRNDSGSVRALMQKPQQRKRPVPEPASDSPAAIRRKIDRSFEVAEQSLKKWKDVRFPGRPHLRATECYPLLPDLEGFPDSGAYVAIKFLNNPLPKSHAYDSRLLSGLFKPIERSPAEEAAYEAALAAHQRDPENVPKPQNPMNYDFYLPETARVGDNFRARFDVDNPDRDEEDLYTHASETGGVFHFSRLRAYETDRETEFEQHEKYDSELFLSFSSDAGDAHGRALHYYPIMQVSQIRPQRMKNIARNIGLVDEEEQVVDQLDVKVEDPTGAVREAMEGFQQNPFGAEEVAEDDVAENGGDKTPEPHTPSDQDAEGDEED